MAKPRKVPLKGERDWTNETIVIDIKNSLGETFHFEIAPGEKDDLPTRASGGPTSLTRGGAVVNMIFPI